MAGTVLCGVDDSPGGRAAAQLAGALSGRLGLRLVLAHVVDGVPVAAEESLTALQARAGGERALAEIAGELEEANGAELRLAYGERAERLAQFAAEEGADLIVLGSDAQGFRGRKLRCTLARDLEAATPVPVVVAPPRTRRPSAQRLGEDAGERARIPAMR